MKKVEPSRASINPIAAAMLDSIDKPIEYAPDSGKEALTSLPDDYKIPNYFKEDYSDYGRVEGASNTVNHPDHYQHISIGHKGKNMQNYEAVDVIEGILDSLDLGSKNSGTLSNVIKYILRAPFKNNEIEDFEKALWYLSRLVDNLKVNEENGKK